MKRLFVPVALGALLVGSLALAAGSSMSHSTMKHTGNHYLVISPHTPEECLKTLDEISAEGTATLAKFDFGCKAGDHTGYVMVFAKDETEALSIVPESIRANAKAIQITKFTAADLKMAHAQADAGNK